ncbi:hypothetical protein [Aurantiacibacter odishensis]|uniref:hypothetical protein n=1 Tax=Aurantiacibacter odishensis TaxID=1155476 RepID=UPI000E739064|nr:hypothetical protein [Aurantiacibacter odishensis]
MVRKFAIVAVAAVLAVGSASQALSNVLADGQPALAVSLSLFAAPAFEQRAVAQVTADPDSNVVDFSAAIPAAQHAVGRELLATEALAVLAMGTQSAAERDAILDAALAASRRGRVLNSAALIAAVERRDDDQLLASLNRTLLLYPSQEEAMIPLLVDQLSNETLVLAFVQILNTGPEWGEQFFRQAAARDELVGNLSRVRLDMSPDASVELEADRAILRAMARTQRLDEAATLFARIRSLEAVPVSSGALGWEDVYTPFHWEFYEQPGAFARPTTDAEAILVSVRSGYGGPLGQRLIRLGEGTTVFEVEHSLDAGAAGRARLTLACPGGEMAWSDALGPSPTIMRVDQNVGCEFAWLGLTARAPSGSPAISGEILSISVREPGRQR